MTIEGNSLYPMTANSSSGRRWQTKLFTTLGTWVVPDDVGCIWIDGCGGGSGGGGGNSTPGGGGGGGNPGVCVKELRLPVVPGEVITITVGANSAGGASNSNSLPAGSTVISGSSFPTLTLQGGYIATAGAAVNGGSSGYSWFGTGSDGISGGAGAGAGGTTFVPTTASHLCGAYPQTQLRMGRGAAGGALGYSGGAGASLFGSTAAAGGVSTGGQPGGGGGGGCSLYGLGGAGGGNGAAGSDATGYGAGGGGGSNASSGGNGSPGFVRIYCFTAYSLA